MSEEITSLNIKRGSIKGKITRFAHFFDSIDKENLDESIINDLQSRLEMIQPLLNEFEEIQIKIELGAGKDSQIDETERTSFENSYFKINGAVNALLKKHISSSSINASDNASVVDLASVHAQSVLNSQSLVKLPPIRLPTFEGKYDSWLEFKDSFLSLVHNNEALNSIQKFYYLRSSLSTEVLEVIKSIDVSSDNYDIAWTFLKDRFENKKLMIHNHIRAIFEHSPLIKESYQELRNLYDGVTKHLRALKSLGEDTDSWDRLIIYILCNKFDPITRREWESFKYANELPNMGDINQFLKGKCEILEKLEISARFDDDSGKYKKQYNKNKTSSSSFASTNLKCYFCKEAHSIYKCPSFLNLSANERILNAKRLKLCLNCLRDSHPSWRCQKQKCQKCNRAHNTLLHSDNYQNKNNWGTAGTAGEINPPVEHERQRAPDIPNTGVEISTTSALVASSGSLSLSAKCVGSQVLLSTAIVRLVNGNQTVTARALLDSGSQSNFISERLCKKLNLPYNKISHAIKGVGDTLTSISKQVNVSIKSCCNNFETNLSCLVLSCITDRLPVMSFNKNILNIPPYLQLADPTFNESGDIEVLLGSSIFWSILGTGQVRLGQNMPILQETKFGYIIAGNFNLDVFSAEMSVNCLSILDCNSSIDDKILKFWEIEELSNKTKNMSESEKFCEDHFINNIKRDDTGRFIVKIPFKENLKLLGDSRDMALNRFNYLEKRLSKNPSLKLEYFAFMSEYNDLNHMSEIIDDREDNGFYLPHHAVIKNSSLTTKCRVVFDAAAKTTSGYSLNNVQFSGPTIQQDVFSILVRFRIYAFVMTGDISKMYRQILVDDSETKYQKIFWRMYPEKEVKVYKLKTVTYGTASAPFLAVRCLFQIAQENKERYPLASKIITRDFYVDDLITGHNDANELLNIQRDIVKLLSNYGFELRKFLCNDKNILNQFTINQDLDVKTIEIGENEQNKTLGIFWDANKDHIRYKINLNNYDTKQKITKRTILSLICQIYDPLGLLGPIIVNAKLIMQELWKLKIGWDEVIPLHLLNMWNTFFNKLNDIDDLKIPRYVMFSKYVSLEMHGFCDASIKAYGACIYIRCEVSDKFYTNLLCAKSRIAPLKQISLPRLELCGALLLANLTKRVTDSLDINVIRFFHWTDSTVALGWIRSESSRWKTFVANRVSEIRSLTNSKNWHHVRSGDNPADPLSRGVSIDILETSNLWWYGPAWFKVSNNNWDLIEPTLNDLCLSEQKITCTHTLEYSNEIINILHMFSSFNKTLRVLAFMLRFISNIKLGKSSRFYGPLQPEEINKSLNLIIKHVQIESFPNEYECLSKNKELPRSSKLLSLNPFLENEVIRVGGRIKNSSQPYERKHPIVLPKGHYLTKQVLKEEHERLLHCGIQNLLYSIRERYWPISGRNACKNIVQNCITCFRVNPKDSINYLMGDLPDYRVNPNFAFTNVGTDFGGPFLLKDRQTRGAKLIKAYMCLFICMSTKAVHIELVTELTTQAFLAALNRFIGRRGKPSNIYSDNGSNYRGANTELKKIYDFLIRNSEYLATQLANDFIKWHFIPAASPSFGGIWEAGIKSAKVHIKRVIGESHLTFEQFATVLTQIEAILNSRPLCPLTQDPDDIAALTPGHFLIGRPITNLPELNLVDVPINRLSKWQHLQVMSQHFWRRWQREYLSELQTRVKWKQNGNSLLKVGSLVLVKEDNTPSMTWPLGRVLALHPGKDGIVRVIELKVSSGTITRAVNRVCVLPID